MRGRDPAMSRSGLDTLQLNDSYRFVNFKVPKEKIKQIKGSRLADMQSTLCVDNETVES